MLHALAAAVQEFGTLGEALRHPFQDGLVHVTHNAPVP